MTMATQMQVTVRLPGEMLFDGLAKRLNAVAQNGAFGILPNHIDFVTGLVPSVLLVMQPDGVERIFGIDEGLLVKTGHTVDIAVRRGVESPDLDTLEHNIGAFFEAVKDEERVARSALSRLEADMVRRFAGLRKDAQP